MRGVAVLLSRRQLCAKAFNEGGGMCDKIMSRSSEERFWSCDIVGPSNSKRRTVGRTQSRDAERVIELEEE